MLRRNLVTITLAASVVFSAAIHTSPQAQAGSNSRCALVSASSASLQSIKVRAAVRCPKEPRSDSRQATTRSAKNPTRASATTTLVPTTQASPWVPLCEDNNSAYRCRLPETNPTPTKTKKHKKAKTPTPAQLREVVAQLRLPDATPRFGPDPSVNEWKMLAVGFPIWLWTDRPTHLTTTAHHEGLDFTLNATWTSTTFTMGDGKTKTCSATSIRPKTVKPATTPSPTCGYVYQTRSKPGHPYTVTAATHWRIDWATNGYQGSFTHTYTGQRSLDVGELHSLING